MTIAEVSRKYGMTQDTLRYYERIGLIPQVPRNKSGIRNYDEESCRWIELMKCMRSAGVQIEALIEYVALFQQGDSTIDARKALLMEQRDQLTARMEDMSWLPTRPSTMSPEISSASGMPEVKLSRYTPAKNVA